MSKISNNRIFILAAVFFTLGIALGSRFVLGANLAYAALAGLVMLFALAFGRRWRVAALVFGCLIFFVFGILRTSLSLVGSEFENFFESKIRLEGLIAEDVDARQERQLLTFRPDGFGQNLLIAAPLSGDYFYGDRLFVEGKISRAKNFSEFDYQGYLERHNVYGLMQYPKILVLKSGQGSWLKLQLLKIKQAFSRQVSAYLAQPKDGLLLGILIGARKTLPQKITADFNEIGLSHILAVSGYNISIIVGALGILVYIFGRRAGFWFSLAAILSFVVISGASASVVRAAVMGIMLLLAFRLGRPYGSFSALCAAAAGMLAINPKILYWDIGFGLSFMATAGIVYGVPLLDGLTPRIKPWFGLKVLVSTTISAIIMTLPLTLVYFGRLSIVALLANLAVLPAVPAVMLFGFFIWLPGLAPGFAFLSDKLLEYILAAASAFSRLPYASLSFRLPKLGAVLMYTAIFTVYYFLGLWAKKLNKARGCDKLGLIKN